MTSPHVYLVQPTPDPLKTQLIAALGILGTCAEASAQLTEGATALDRLPPFFCAQMQRMSVAIAATVAGLQAELGRIEQGKRP